MSLMRANRVTERPDKPARRGRKFRIPRPLRRGLLVFVLLGVAQVALVLHARNVLVADAAEGARTAAVRGGSLARGEQACARLVG